MSYIYTKEVARTDALHFSRGAFDLFPAPFE